MLPPQGTPSVWSTDVVLPEFPPADQFVGVDVAIVGGGITGLTTGVLLQRAGVRTAVLEQHRLGSGESGRTSAHLTEYPDAGYDRLATDFGPDGARAVAASKREAIRQIETFAATIPCDFQRVSGYLYTERPGDTTLLRTERDASRAAGVTVHALDRAPLPFATAGALEFSDQAQFHPRKYLAGLIDLYLAAGGRIFEQTPVRGVDPCNGECRVRTPSWTAHVDRVLAVTHSPITAGPLLDTKLRANTLHAVSPTCTHMGCDVAWNTLEHTWDCPCHGSRYAPDGQLLHGPATAPLESLATLAVSGRRARNATPFEQAFYLVCFSLAQLFMG
ncbi:MAG TPA: FAD-dependent oxidoreductase [Vicinamibacterales bacterium]|nr:FAD-dependent oxidoreductase [Vicinamibacterales bacterium]